MKIRKFIVESKIQQIEKQYQYVFVYHCSGLTNQEWRHLRNLLVKIDAKVLYQPSLGKKNRMGSRQVSENEPTILSKISLSKKEEKENEALLKFNNHALSGPFCIFFLKAKMDKTDIDAQSNWSEMIKKIESLEYQTKLVLLYARIKSVVVNHIDIKQALNLDAHEVVQNLFLSIQHPSSSLTTVLSQNKTKLLSLFDQNQKSESTEESSTT